MTNGQTTAATAPEADIDEQPSRQRRAAVERRELRDEIVVIGAGTAVAIPGRPNRTHPFDRKLAWSRPEIYHAT